MSGLSGTKVDSAHSARQLSTARRGNTSLRTRWTSDCVWGTKVHSAHSTHAAGHHGQYELWYPKPQTYI